MADLAQAKNCPNCGTLVTCSGDLQDKVLNGQCVVDGTPMQLANPKYTEDPNKHTPLVDPDPKITATQAAAPEVVTPEPAQVTNGGDGIAGRSYPGSTLPPGGIRPTGGPLNPADNKPKPDILHNADEGTATTPASTLQERGIATGAPATQSSAPTWGVSPGSEPIDASGKPEDNNPKR